jgi:hypothetical protein
VAVRVPVAAGLNVTLAVQLAAAARLVPHVLLAMLKSPASVPEIATPLIVIEAALPLLKVADCAALVEPTEVLVKERLEGDAVTVPVELAPVPVKETDCGLPVAESVNLSVAVRVPAAAGLNVTLAVQLAAAARLVPHVLLEMLKSPGSVPEIATLLIVIEAALPLLKVADCAAVVEPTAVLAKVSADGLIVTLPLVPVPVPESAIVCGLPVAVSVKFSVAVRLPAAVGPNETLTVQAADAARLVPQVLLSMMKSPGSAPEKAMLLIVTALVPPFVSVTTFCAPLSPIATLAQFKLLGLTEALPVAPAVPVPVSATVCGLPLAESVKVRVAVRVPVAAGLNVTLAVQLVAAARLVPQVLLEMVKSPASVPVIATLLIVIEAALPLVNVDGCAALLEPIAVLAKESSDGLIVTLPVVPVPVPESATVCGLPLPVSVKFKVAVRLPVALGPNKILTVQSADAARLVPQVLLNIVKSAASVPDKAMLLMVIAPVPPFVSVTAFWAPSSPTATLTQLRLVGDGVTAARQLAPWSAHIPKTTCTVANPNFHERIALPRLTSDSLAESRS